jgi:hypothetical protein
MMAQPHDRFVASFRGFNHSRINVGNGGNAPLIVAQPHDGFVASTRGCGHCLMQFYYK